MSKLLFLIISLFMPAAVPAPDAHRAQPERCVCVGNPPVPITPAPVTPPEHRPVPVHPRRYNEQ